MDSSSSYAETYLSNPYINETAINAKVKEIIYKANTLNGNNRTAWFLRAITCIDLTTLEGDNTQTNIEDLCKKAFGCADVFHTAAVCIYPTKAAAAKNALRNFEDEILDPDDKIRVATVAAGFPSGLYPLGSRLKEIEYCVSLGVHEIDIVIDRSLVLAQRWSDLYEELTAMRIACGSLCMKTILAVGELPSLGHIYRASMIAMYAGSDFIKTSTGKETLNASLPVGIIMCRAIRDYYAHTNRKVGFKPAGGIKSAVEALQWLVLVKEELGNQWLDKKLFRIGASSLLDDILKQFK